MKKAYRFFILLVFVLVVFSTGCSINVEVTAENIGILLPTDSYAAVQENPITTTQTDYNIAVREIPITSIPNRKRVVLDVKNIQQLPELPAGCEITSTTMALRYWGFDIDKITLLDYLPIMECPDEKNMWASPWECFVGNPEFSYYGCFSTVIDS